MSAMEGLLLHRNPGGAVGRSATWVLVVDDKVVVRDLLERFLVLEGYKVMSAADGLEAVRLFQAHPGTFQAAILDVLMPRMDGRDTFYALRQVDPMLPVLIMSGFAPGERADEIIGRPGTNFIHKPFVLGDVLLRLEQLLAQRGGTAAPPAAAPTTTLRLEGITD
ncbi:MAG: response regulator [Candidatus Eisenbacteria bacterium]|nr:response regulator [Candidatus Eisenbacteria bacterium]